MTEAWKHFIKQELSLKSLSLLQIPIKKTKKNKKNTKQTKTQPNNLLEKKNSIKKSKIMGSPLKLGKSNW